MAYSTSASAYGTFDQSGNAFEWNETVSGLSFRGLRGGSYSDGFSDYLLSSQSYDQLPNDENNSAFGFRVATVPEPVCILSVCFVVGAFALSTRSRVLV